MTSTGTLKPVWGKKGYTGRQAPSMCKVSAEPHHAAGVRQSTKSVLTPDMNLTLQVTSVYSAAILYLDHSNQTGLNRKQEGSSHTSWIKSIKQLREGKDSEVIVYYFISLLFQLKIIFTKFHH